jgi:hypothetical protein
LSHTNAASALHGRGGATVRLVAPPPAGGASDPAGTLVSDEIKVKFVICSNCELVIPAAELVRHDHDFETDDEWLVVYDYHCPSCRAKLASWGTR